MPRKTSGKPRIDRIERLRKNGDTCVMANLSYRAQLTAQKAKPRILPARR